MSPLDTLTIHMTPKFRTGNSVQTWFTELRLDGTSWDHLFKHCPVEGSGRGSCSWLHIECHQGWRFHNSSEQSAPIFHHPYSKNSPSFKQKFLFHIVLIASCLVPWLLMTTLQAWHLNQLSAHFPVHSSSPYFISCLWKYYRKVSKGFQKLRKTTSRVLLFSIKLVLYYNKTQNAGQMIKF